MKLVVGKSIMQLKTRLSSLFSSYRELEQKINSATIHERGIILGSMVTIVFATWYFTLALPVSGSVRKLKVQVQIRKQQVSASEIEYQRAVTTISGVSDKKKVKDLKATLVALDKKIENTMGHVVPADKLADVLKQILIKEGNLKLISLKSLPSTSMLGGANKNDGAGYQLLKQGLTITFNGDYANTYRYLKNLEKVKWQLFWSDLSYKVEKYPNATVSLTVHTLVQYKPSPQYLKKLSQQRAAKEQQKPGAKKK